LTGVRRRPAANHGCGMPGAHPTHIGGPAGVHIARRLGRAPDER
jgi:hypothetical protein